MGSRVSAREVAAYFHVDERIVPYIPDLLAEFDDLGSFPETIVSLLEALALPEETRVLDLGSGFGAVSRAIARGLGFRVTGVDMLEPFVIEAGKRAASEGVGRLCDFLCDDIRDFLASDPRFDVIMLVSVGDVLGPMDATVGRLRRAVRDGGYLVIDDGYAADDAPMSFPGYEYVETRERSIARLTAHGDELVREVAVAPLEIRRQNRVYLERITARVHTLSAEHPEHRGAFERFLDRERKESALIEDHLVCATWVLKRSDSP
jgi:SAM-dependent methyltransferase